MQKVFECSCQEVTKELLNASVLSSNNVKNKESNRRQKVTQSIRVKKILTQVSKNIYFKTKKYINI